MNIGIIMKQTLTNTIEVLEMLYNDATESKKEIILMQIIDCKDRLKEMEDANTSSATGC